MDIWTFRSPHLIFLSRAHDQMLHLTIDMQGNLKSCNILPRTFLILPSISSSVGGSGRLYTLHVPYITYLPTGYM